MSAIYNKSRVVANALLWFPTSATGAIPMNALKYL